MNKKKIFSIVIPFYNAEKTIERTLASLISNKEYIHEVILVNDGSSDKTINKIEPFKGFFRIIILNNQGNKGAGISRDNGLYKATGKWITFVDADDCLTPSCLRYVYSQIQDNEELILLHSQSIYYESGNFDVNSICHSDYSCGGNYYKRRYLVDNNLHFHDSLYLSEDEYFNEVVIKYIQYCYKNSNEYSIQYYDYPTYEVHHDVEDGYSFAMSNWCNYLIKYHLLNKEYVTDYFIKNEDIKEILLEEYCNNFIFCFFLAQCLMLDNEFNFKLEEHKQHFKRAILYYLNTFDKNVDYLINYYKENNENTNNIHDSATISTGIEFINFINFENFIRNLNE